MGLLHTASQACVIMRLRVDAIGAVQRFLSFSTGGSAATPRLIIGLNAIGNLSVQVRRGDADSTTVAASGAVVFSAATTHSLIVTVDYAAGGTGAIKGYVDGPEVLSASLASTGAASATDSLRARLMANLASSAADHLDGRLSRCIVASGTSAIPTSTERTAIFTELSA
ncbi:hypothetical protein EKK58_08210 [Candidatus Dependentiae bacterium]|nr:MAG: hypothetical protein EKK58_08210 [Candidatus Dependentiae bacterium]